MRVSNEEADLQFEIKRKIPGMRAIVTRERSVDGRAVLVGSYVTGWTRAVVCRGGDIEARADRYAAEYNRA